MVSAIILGIVTGSLYGLFAVGLVAPYRATKVLNLGHGEIGMAGTFVFIEMRRHDQPVVPSLLLGVAAGAALAALVLLVVVRPVVSAPLRALVASFGVGALITTWAARRYGTSPIAVPAILTGDPVEVLGARISAGHALMFGCVVVVLALFVLYVRSMTGLRDRAVADDWEAAGQSGISVRLAMVRAWAIGGAIAALCGILISPLVGFTVFFMTSLMFRSLVAALVTGLTSPLAAFGAGVALGVGENLIGRQTSTPGVVEAVLAAVTIALLLVRPRWMTSELTVRL